MSFGEHLEELRSRLINALIGVAVCCLFTLYYGRAIMMWLFIPLLEVLREANVPEHLYIKSTVAGFTVYLKVSLIAGLVLATPWVIYQFWKFIEAGLYPGERRAVMLIAPMSAVMTALGVLFTYYIFLPAALSFLIVFATTYPTPELREDSTTRRITKVFTIINDWTAEHIPGMSALVFKSQSATQPAATAPAPESLTPMIVPIFESDPETPKVGQVWFNKSAGEVRIFEGSQVRALTMTARSAIVPMIDPADYINEVAVLGLIIVLVFQIPVVMTLLGAIGLVSPALLKKYRLYVFFGCVVASVIFTPGQDVFSNLALPILMYILFEIGLIFMGYAYRRHQANSPPDEGSDSDSLMS